MITTLTKYKPEQFSILYQDVDMNRISIIYQLYEAAAGSAYLVISRYHQKNIRLYITREEKEILCRHTIHLAGSFMQSCDERVWRKHPLELYKPKPVVLHIPQRVQNGTTN
jgi:hypothetical protein